MDVQKSIMYLVVSQLVLFVWYYLTLPGSVLVSDKSKSNKPSLSIALQHFVLYQLPYYLLLIFLMYYIKNNNNLVCEQLKQLGSDINNVCPK